jgi:hypothetical protein
VSFKERQGEVIKDNAFEPFLYFRHSTPSHLIMIQKSIISPFTGEKTEAQRPASLISERTAYQFKSMTPEPMPLTTVLHGFVHALTFTEKFYYPNPMLNDGLHDPFLQGIT